MQQRFVSTLPRVGLVALVMLVVVVGCATPAAPTAVPPTAVKAPATPTAAAALPTKAPAAKTIKIGVIGPLTGGAAYWGRMEMYAIQMATEEINAKGGINGAQVVLDIQDDRGDKTEVANVTRRFIQDPDVIVILGSLISGEVFVEGPIANQAGITMIGTGSSASGIPAIGPYVFRVSITLGTGVPRLLSWVKEQRGIKKLAIMSSLNNDYSVDSGKLMQNTAKNQGVELVAVESYSDGDSNFSAQMSKILSAKPDAIFLSGYAPEGALIATEARKQGYTGLFLGGDGMTDGKVLQSVAGKSINGLLVFAQWDKGVELPQSKAFAAAFLSKFGEDPEGTAAAAYDSARIAFAALAKSGPDRKAFRDAVAATQSFEGLTGKFGFDPVTREVEMPVTLMEYSDGQFRYVGLK